LATYSGGLRTVRVVADSKGWNAHAAAASPALGVSETSSTPRSLCTTAENATEPRVVVIVPPSSALYRSSVQSTAVTAPARVSVRKPIGSRDRPMPASHWIRWSCTWVWLSMTLSSCGAFPA
jgi:hypothetical protein